jgi:hypothetical protein
MRRALALVLAACAPAAPPAPREVSVVIPETSAAPAAEPAAARSIDEATLLDGDPELRFGERAWVEMARRYALRREDPWERVDDPNIEPFEVVVVDEHKGGRVRVIAEERDLRFVVVLDLEDLATRIRERTALFERPDEPFPDGVSLELAGGAAITESAVLDGWRQVHHVRDGVSVAGWLPPGKLGRIYRADAFSLGDVLIDLEVVTGTELRGPGGHGSFASFDPIGGWLGVVRALGPAESGWRPIELVLETARVRGFVADGHVADRPPSHYGGSIHLGKIGTISHVRWLELPENASIAREQGGPPLARAIGRSARVVIEGDPAEGHIPVRFSTVWGPLRGLLPCKNLTPIAGDSYRCD